MKKNVRVDIPISSPDEFSKLANLIITKHKELGDKSPLTDEIVNALDKLAKFQAEKRAEANRLHAEAQAATLDADTALGIAKGQNVNTPDTMYNAVTIIRDMLLLAFKGREEMLSEFGFNVVIGTSKSPSKNSDTE